ncbi:hypothetical protein [Aquabacterium sp. CECT 9606]|uniref:hypothetical protein n=1 Tax=Aquabacterium sp. CECT 9606 TaxID=2845822 RepID=UPI001E5FCC3C|nr:hypothetical protein [Aquabacterium sp. CECT 9606]CAH0351028.1 hypothetical protein AQB9606_01888 [Aquabacterium sp. CECT 9606]
MERLLLLRIEAAGCQAEAVLNGVPVASVDARTAPGTHVACVPVHEYTLAGGNRLGLVVNPHPINLPANQPPPPPTPNVADGHTWVKLRLLLPRQGQPASENSARTLAQLDWALAENEVYETPLLLSQTVDLPVTFPRWRWLDAPVVDTTPALKMQALAFLQRLAIDLTRGDPESLIAAARLRFEELALAYQRDIAIDVGRFRAHVQQLSASKTLRIAPPTAADLILRPVADGRLLECLGPTGQPILRTLPTESSSSHAWPIRLAVVDGQFYVLR